EGTPTSTGISNVTIRVEDSTGAFFEKPFSIAVVALGPASLPDAAIGLAYTQNLSLNPTHDQDTELWSVVSGQLPPGLELTDAGIIHGTPSGPMLGYQFGIQESAIFGGVRTQCVQ